MEMNWSSSFYNQFVIARLTHDLINKVQRIFELKTKTFFQNPSTGGAPTRRRKCDNFNS